MLTVEMKSMRTDGSASVRLDTWGLHANDLFATIILATSAELVLSSQAAVISVSVHLESTDIIVNTVSVLRSFEASLIKAFYL